MSGWIWLTGVMVAGGQPGMAGIWGLVADHQSQEARIALQRLPAGASDPRERTLAGVVLVLARPPLPEGQWAGLDQALAEIATGEDDLAAQALYLRARLRQVHVARPDHGQAVEFYRELARRRPGSHWAQLGLVKLGLIWLYALPEPADPAVRLAAVAELLPDITEPALRRDLHLQLGWAGLFHGRPLTEVLPHLIAADDVGGFLGITAEDLVLQIGELSLRAGRRDQARQYLERFLRDYPTTIRRYNVQQRLRELEERPGAAKRLTP